MTDKKPPEQESFEGWTDHEINVFLCIRFLHSLHGVFGRAYDTLKNPVWFINGMATEILADLKLKREALAGYLESVHDEEIRKLVKASLKKMDEYIRDIGTTLEDPQVQRRIVEVQKRLQETAS